LYAASRRICWCQDCRRPFPGRAERQHYVENNPRHAGARKVGVKFALHVYDYDPGADHIGLQAAAALGIEPRRMLKTLMAEVDGKPVCVVVPSDREVSMKKLAAAFRGKAANMMRPADAERLTGYHVGGISPFAQKKRVPVAIEQTALTETSVYLNGGQRGLQIELDPRDAVGALDATVQALTG
jgi:Cys-tRNA(Pro)/Cys-tRNA(Cys) deacylase